LCSGGFSARRALAAAAPAVHREAVALTFAGGGRLRTGDERGQADIGALGSGRSLLARFVTWLRLALRIRLLLFTRRIILLFALRVRFAATGIRLHAVFGVVEILVRARLSALGALLERLVLAGLLLR
jgi:hypothetical protein